MWGNEVAEHGEQDAGKHGEKGRHVRRCLRAVDTLEAEKLKEEIFGERAVLQGDRQRLFGDQKKDREDRCHHADHEGNEYVTPLREKIVMCEMQKQRNEAER